MSPGGVKSDELGYGVGAEDFHGFSRLDGDDSLAGRAQQPGHVGKDDSPLAF